MSILEKPTFENTVFQDEIKLNPSGSHIDRETHQILFSINDDKPVGIVSLGHSGISTAKIIKNSHVFVPKNIPFSISNEIKEFTKNIHFMGNNYNECFEASKDYMFQQDIINITPGVVERYAANKDIIDEMTKRILPEYIFVPSINLDLAMGLRERLDEKGLQDIIIVACVLPDHLLSPRFNFTYDRTPFFPSIVNSEELWIRPSLNNKIKYYQNIIINTIKNPNHCYAKYKNAYPNIDSLNYVAMEISTKYNSHRKAVIITGRNIIN